MTTLPTTNDTGRATTLCKIIFKNKMSLEENLEKCQINTEDSDSSTARSTQSLHSDTPTTKTDKSKRGRLSRLEKYLQRNTTEHILVPISCIKSDSSKSSPRAQAKWTDVGSIVYQGETTHRNLDPHRTRHVEVLTTLSSGTLRSMLVKEKAYAAQVLPDHSVTLQQLLACKEQRKSFVETHGKFVCINLLMALRFLHAHDVFHGSICPAKVVFNNKGYPLLTGFGTADIIDERQSRPRERTQLEYTSPEQLWWEHMTEVTDVWSTACLVYAVMYGRPPHQGIDTAHTRRNICNAKFIPEFVPHSISAPGKRFILKCIRKSERRRFSVCDVKSFPDEVTWFNGLNEEKLYKQSLQSPLLDAIKKCEINMHKSVNKTE